MCNILGFVKLFAELFAVEWASNRVFPWFFFYLLSPCFFKNTYNERSSRAFAGKLKLLSPFPPFSSQFVLYSCFCLLMKRMVYLYVIIYCYLFSCIFYVESDCIVSKRCYGKVIVKFKVAWPSNIFGKSDGNFCSAVKTNVLNWDFFSSCVCKCFM